MTKLVTKFIKKLLMEILYSQIADCLREYEQIVVKLFLLLMNWINSLFKIFTNILSQCTAYIFDFAMEFGQGVTELFLLLIHLVI